MRDAGCGMRDAGCGMPGSGMSDPRIRDSRLAIQKISDQG
jgi:hypothetical protein